LVFQLLSPCSPLTFPVQDANSFAFLSITHIILFLHGSHFLNLFSYTIPYQFSICNFSSILYQFYCLFLGSFDILHLPVSFFRSAFLSCPCSSFLSLYLPF
jgi:ABC-type multidrug transport system permease subunit